MNIVHVCPLYYPSLGGNQIHVQVLSEKLADLGHEIHVLTANVIDRSSFNQSASDAPDLPASEDINGVHIHRIKLNRRLQSFLTRDLFKIRGGTRFAGSVLKESLGYWQSGPCTVGMVKAVKKVRPDILLAVMDNSFTTYQCYQVKKKTGIPFVFMPITHQVDNGRHRDFVSEIYKTADLIIACTPYEKDLLVDRGADAGKVRVLPLGLKPDLLEGYDADAGRAKFGISSDHPTVAYIGRQDNRKGVDILVRAMRRVWKDHPEARLLLAGKSSASFAPVLEDELAALDQDELNKVINVGRFDPDDKKDLYAAVDLVVMASNIDCFGLVYLEAWACRKPVIACRNTPQETIIDEGKNGLLVEYGNEEDLALKIGELIDDPAKRHAFGENGHQKFMTEYNLDHYGPRLEMIYKELVGECKS